MEARRCDRCGKYYDIYNDGTDRSKKMRLTNESNIKQPNGIMTYMRGVGAAVGSYDLCPDCMSELADWLHIEPEEEGEEDD